MPWLIAEAEVLEKPTFESTSFRPAPWPTEHFDPDAFRRIAPHVQERVSTLVGGPRNGRLPVPRASDDRPRGVGVRCRRRSAKAILDAAIAAYESCEFEPEELHRVTGEIAESVGRKLAKAQAPIRVAITGKRVGPPLFESMAILGREKVLERLRGARARLDAAA